MWTGRVVGFTASLIAAAAIGWAVHRTSRNSVIAAFSGLTFLASNYTFHIGPLFRQHMTMVMFETLAMVALARAGERADWHKSRACWAAMTLLLAAGYTKQLALASVLAALTFLFLRGPRRAVLTGLGLTAVAGGLFLWINHVTEGWWFVSIIRANINEFQVAQALGFYRQWVGLHLLIALAALGRVLYETYAACLSVYAVWFVFAFANSVLSGKFGSGESYFVTATAAACVVSGIAVAAVWRRSRSPSLCSISRRLGSLCTSTPPAPSTARWRACWESPETTATTRTITTRRATPSSGRGPNARTTQPGRPSPPWRATHPAPCSPKKPGSYSGPASPWSQKATPNW
jgi:hypothetical protein